jgi:hypothetical protein
MFDDDAEVIEDKQNTCDCFWCGNDASLTNVKGEMYSLLYDKIICDDCLNQHHDMLIRYHSVFQLALF